MAKECSNSSCSKESCEGCPSKAGQGKPDFHIDLNADSSIKHVIGVVSGEGSGSNYAVFGNTGSRST